MTPEEKIEFYNDIPTFMRHSPHMFIMQQNMMIQQQQLLKQQKKSEIQKNEPNNHLDTESSNLEKKNNNNNNNHIINSNNENEKGNETDSKKIKNAGMVPQGKGPEIMKEIFSDPDTKVRMEKLALRVTG